MAVPAWTTIIERWSVRCVVRTSAVYPVVQVPGQQQVHAAVGGRLQRAQAAADGARRGVARRGAKG